MFLVREVAVPYTRDDAHVQDPELRREEVEVDGLSSWPQRPVSLQATAQTIAVVIISMDNQFPVWAHKQLRATTRKVK